MVEAHASRAEDAARTAGAGVADIAEVALMAFAGANCQREADEWALIEWRATRLAMVLSGLDFGGPLPRQGQVGSGDVLVRTIRTVAAALSAMASAKHAAADPLRGDGVTADAGRALARAMDALAKAAADAPLHRNIGGLIERRARVTDAIDRGQPPAGSPWRGVPETRTQSSSTGGRMPSTGELVGSEDLDADFGNAPTSDA